VLRADCRASRILPVGLVALRCRPSRHFPCRPSYQGQCSVRGNLFPQIDKPPDTTLSTEWADLSLLVARSIRKESWHGLTMAMGIIMAVLIILRARHPHYEEIRNFRTAHISAAFRSYL